MNNLLPRAADPVVRRSLQLRQSQWEAIERLAVALETLATKGPTIGKPSWRTLMARLSEWDAPKTEQPTPLDEFIAIYFGLEDTINS